MALIGEKEGRSEALVRRTREQCNEVRHEEGVGWSLCVQLQEFKCEC